MEVPQIMTFRPTMEEFKDFSKYIHKMEKMGAHMAGLAKVIPPKGWVARKGGYKNIGNIIIPCPITQTIQGKAGVYEVFNMEPRNIKSGGMSVSEFEKKAISKEYATPLHSDAADLERRYWTNIAYNPPLYGADVSGSLYDADQEVWDVGHLKTILDSVFSTLGDEGGLKIEGVNTAYLYFGMWKSTFAWHTEDMDLYSINYLHFGSPKFWYAVPPKYGRRLERVAQMFFKNKADICPGFLRHKCYLLSPTILKKFNVPFNKMLQEEGQFVITFPYAYHAGFNHGYNCAESTNFATERWIEYGKRCKRCYCIKEMVQIDMDCFVKKYQPNKYKAWVKDEDVAPHPEDDERRKISRSLSLAGCTKWTGEQPSKRHPLSINFGTSPGKESTSEKKRRREGESGREKEKKLKRIPGKILKTSLRSKLKKRSILVSCRRSMETRAQKLKLAVPPRPEEEEKEGVVLARAVRRFRSHRAARVEESPGEDSPASEDVDAIRDPTFGVPASELEKKRDGAEEASTFSGRVCPGSIPGPAESSGGSSGRPGSLTSRGICRRGCSLRTNPKKRQGRDDFYTPLAERVKLRRASDTGRSTKSPSDVESQQSTDLDATCSTMLQQVVDKQDPVDDSACNKVSEASASQRSSRCEGQSVTTRRQPIRRKRRRTSRRPRKSEIPAIAGLPPSDPDEPQMPRLVPIAPNRGRPSLRPREDEEHYSGKDAPTLDCFG